MSTPDLELDKDIEALNTFIQNIIEKDNISFNKLFSLLKEKNTETKTIKIPSSIFKERSLGILEALTVYLKEQLKLSYKEISTLVNRDNRVIWTTYNNARKKFNRTLQIDPKSTQIPIPIFTDRKIGLLEALVLYIKKLHLKNSEISIILNRSSKTISTTFSRVKKKI